MDKVDKLADIYFQSENTHSYADTEEYRSRYWGSVKYFKFKDNTHSWILPVYEGSYTAQHPAESFPWNKSCKFVGEVTENA